MTKNVQQNLRPALKALKFYLVRGPNGEDVLGYFSTREKALAFLNGRTICCADCTRRTTIEEIPFDDLPEPEPVCDHVWSEYENWPTCVHCGIEA